MDHKQIKDFVQSVAEIKEIKPVTDGSRPPDETTEVVYNGEWIELDRHCNPTLGFKFIKLKSVERPCMIGCGEMVTDQRVEKRLAFTPQKHWRTRCANCGLYISPNGEELIEGGHAVQAAFIKHFKSIE